MNRIAASIANGLRRIRRESPVRSSELIGRRFHHADDRGRITTVIDEAGGYVRTQDNDGTRYVMTVEGLGRNWIELGFKNDA